MPEGWRWDDTLYRGAGAYYAAGRLPYPRALAGAIAREAGLDGTQRLLDVGCGPGSLTLLLAPHAAVAVGVDADPEMIAAAGAEAERAGVANAEWQQLRAEELPAGLGRFALVTFAQSFHWFDRAAVAATVHGMLEPGGACVHVSATTHRGDASDDVLPHPRPPYDDVEAIVRRYLGPVRRAGRGVLAAGTPSGEAEIFGRAGFTRHTRVELDTAEVVTRSADEIVAAIFSLSSSTPHLLGPRVGDFEAELRALLAEASPDGLFAERTRDVALDVWRP